jgi:putative Mg2+ transporter-C (MgtC) family protein
MEYFNYYLSYFRELNIYSMMLRIALAMLVGGLIGFEREKKGQAAGFRTYMVVAIGAASTIMLGQFYDLMFNGPWAEISAQMGIRTDVSRFGAQVINGVGFLGAGTIMVTGRQEVKGLTTAAGLWTAAIIGLVCGAGFAELAVLVTAMVLFAELVLSKIESKFARKVSDVNIYIEYSRAAAIEEIYAILREKKIVVSNFEISRVRGSETQHHYCAVISFRASKAQMDAALHKSFTEVKDVITVEEI